MEEAKESRRLRSFRKLPHKWARQIAWCVTCGTPVRFKVCEAFTNGLPECCGQKMTVYSPQERQPRDARGRFVGKGAGE